MRLSEDWLRQWVNPNETLETIADRLTLAGCEVTAIEPAAARFSHVVVGMIECIEALGDNAKLTVNVGRTITVVTTHAGCSVGQRVAIAMIGAHLPGCDSSISEKQVAGVRSEGMLCTEHMLALGDESQWPLVIDDTVPVGTDCYEALHLDDQIITVEFTPNRGDCLSIRGLAREISVHFNCDWQDMPIATVPAEHEEQLSVTLAEGCGCRYYTSRIITGINGNIKTPRWIQERLRRAGVRLHSPIVDISNYVMFELGQPLHAFDARRLTGNINLRRAHAGEKITLLDAVTLSLQGNEIVVCDDEQPIALGGIMGCADSAVNDETQSIVLESAHFEPTAIAGRARQHGLATDASYRYERGVDMHLVDKAMARATALICDITGGKPGPVSSCALGSQPPKPLQTSLRMSRITGLLGTLFTREQVETTLEHLGFVASRSPDGWLVTIPSYRYDVSQEVDLIEEVARVLGYQHIESSETTTIQFQTIIDANDNGIAPALRTCLRDFGYNEAITYSFVDPYCQQAIHPEASALTLQNPISQELSAMRLSLLPGLLGCLKYNQDRQMNDVRLFEIGPCFQQREGSYDEISLLGVINSSNIQPRQWSSAERLFDFYDLKGQLEHLLAMQGWTSGLTWTRCNRSYFHPGKSATLHLTNRPIAWIGALHPSIIKLYELKQPVVYLEMSLDILALAKRPEVFSPSRFPAIRRDISLLVDETVSWQQLVDIVRQHGGTLLTDVTLFDVYKDDRLGAGKKSLALGLTLQHRSRTLIDSEVNQVVDTVVQALKVQIAATMRE